MTTHEQAQELLYLKTDRTLTPSEEQVLDTHLSTCWECQENFKEWTRVQTALFSSPAAPSSDTESFIETVMSRLPPQNVWNGAWWKIPALALGSFLILYIGPRLGDQSDTTRSLLLEKSSSEQAQQLLAQSDAGSEGFFNLLLEDTPS